MPMSRARYKVAEPRGKTRVLKSEKASVKDIMRGIVMADNDSYQQTEDYAKGFDFNKFSEFKRLWSDVRYDIDYVEDPFGLQIIKSPAATWKSRFADCKSKSLFIGSVMKNSNLEYFYRFTHYGNPSQGHVYPVVFSPLFGEIIMDSVHTVFNEEVPYVYKIDYDPDTAETFDQIGSLSDSEFGKFIKLIGWFTAFWLILKR